MKENIYIFPETHDRSVIPTDYSFSSFCRTRFIFILVFIFSLQNFFPAALPKDSAALPGNTRIVAKGFIYIGEGAFIKNSDKITFNGGDSDEKKKNLKQERKRTSAKYKSLKVNKPQKINRADKIRVQMYVTASSNHQFASAGTKGAAAISAQNDNTIKKLACGVGVLILLFSMIIHYRKTPFNIRKYIYEIFTDTDTIRPPPFLP